MTTWNTNRPHGFGVLNPDTFAPYPKNHVIGAFFREIDRADELGSGMRKMMMYGKKYGVSDPQLIEGDVFRMIISVRNLGKNLQTLLDVSQQQFLLGQSRGQSRFLKESSGSCLSVPDHNPNWLLRLANGRYQEN